ncbi:hypothetical protein ACPUEK_10990 [Marinomonas gallaica]|uniref:hypothetical protein n=1 Tax=Marinomonas gallaica TaxID=1806667 RepID=UPI003CE4B336
MKKTFKKSKLNTCICVALLGTPLLGHAYTLVDNEDSTVTFGGEAIIGAFHSQERYDGTDGSPSWQEGFIKYGLSMDKKMGNGELFGAVNAVSSGTWGDGDAGGATTGDERETEIEDLFIGYRADRFQFSVGRQQFVVGDGFIINGDALNLGSGLDAFATDITPNRGGALWLAPRKAFGNTAILSLGGEQGWRSDIYWLESDNAGQASTEMAGINFENNSANGTFGFLYNQGLSVDEKEANFFGLNKRDGQKTMSVRYQGNAGVEQLFLSSEFVKQTQGDNSEDANAWYAEAGWTFSDMAWSPSVNYRFTRYDEGYDPLFYGFSRGYGTWFQGEVAANYAGTSGGTIDSDIQSLNLIAHPTDMLTVGAVYFDISNTSNGTDRNDAKELDIWAEWVVNEHLIVSPLIGYYTPDSSNSNQGNTDTNMYSQVIAIMPF